MEERQKIVEDEFKQNLSKRIKQIINETDRIIREIEGTETRETSGKGLKNIGITINNKIVELQHQFEEKGLSMYSRKNTELDFYESSFLGDVIIKRLIDYVVEGIQGISGYYQEAEQILDEKNMQIEKNIKRNPIRKMLAKLTGRGLIQLQEVEIIQDELRRLSTYLRKYENIDNEIWKYNLKDNIVESIVTKVKREPATKELIELEVIPDLQKLGLEEVIPQLREEIKQVPEGTLDYETIILAIKEYEKATGITLGISDSEDKEKMVQNFKEQLKVKIEETKEKLEAEHNQEDNNKSQKQEKQQDDTFER